MTGVFVQNGIPFVAFRGGLIVVITPYRRRTEDILYTAAGVVRTENFPGCVQIIPAYSMGYVIIRNKQAVVVFIPSGVFFCSGLFARQLVGVDRPHIGKGDPVEGGVGDRGFFCIRRSRNLRLGQVKPVGITGG